MHLRSVFWQLKHIFSRNLMRTSLLRSVLLLAVLLVGYSTIAAQPAPAQRSAAMAFSGETLTYEGKVSRLRIGVSVAEMTFKAEAPQDSDKLFIKTDAVSKGTLLKLFRFSFVQNYESAVDLANFRIIKTVKHDVQKERVRDSEALFDYGEKRVTWVETDPKDKNRPPRRIASEIGQEMHDMVSAIYAVRLQPLVVGKRFDVSVSDSGLVYQVPVVVTGREQQKTVLGKVWCFKIEPEIFGRGRLIEQKGKMVIWMTEDSRRVPVRSQIDSQYGKIDIKLKSVVSPK